MPGLGPVVILLVANVIWLLLNLFASWALKLSCEGANLIQFQTHGTPVIHLTLHPWLDPCLTKSQVASLQTAHSWANAGVLLGDACIGSGVAFEAI